MHMHMYNVPVLTTQSDSSRNLEMFPFMVITLEIAMMQRYEYAIEKRKKFNWRLIISRLFADFPE